ncbi:MAG: nucleotidyltransferase substrate binding protein [Acidimicrobiaceae bacterium]|nr:nucleotidyltransferase substrate binding protein [Acidimicrobiaceae bacterium]
MAVAGQKAHNDGRRPRLHVSHLRERIIVKLDTGFLERCIQTLEAALDRLHAAEGDALTHDIFRAACVKEFEIILEQCSVLLRKRLRAYMASNRQADQLAFKPIFRQAARHGLITAAECERWLEYRNQRNNTAHLYGEETPEAILGLLPAFVVDARSLATTISTPVDE